MLRDPGGAGAAVVSETTLGLFTIFVLSVFVGFEVISKVSPILHTPLMSGANAIHGVILVGAIIVLGTGDGTVQTVLGFLAVVLATINVVGGFAAGLPAARLVKMTAIPQMVAAFNGVGGGAAALVSLAEFNKSHAVASTGTAAAVLFSVLVGALSFSGSAVTYAKLQELMTGRPIVLPQQRLLNAGLGVAALALVIWGLAAGSFTAAVLLAVVALAFGVLFVLPVGGADVPVVISLLNAFTGLAVAASGAVLRMPLLIIAGTLVGASGTLLTQLMATAMGRPLTSILFGAITAKPTTAAVEGDIDRSVRTGTVDDVAILLAYARRVVVVPGYGLAVAQAQHRVPELANLLEARGAGISY